MDRSKRATNPHCFNANGTWKNGQKFTPSQRYTAKRTEYAEIDKWVTLPGARVAMPIRGGEVVTADATKDYEGDLGGLLIFDAENLNQALELTNKSPGLKYGFTYEVFPEISMAEVAAKK